MAAGDALGQQFYSTQQKQWARKRLDDARTARLSGDPRLAEGNLRHAAVHRDQALRGKTNKTTWMYGDLKKTRKLP